MAVLVVMLAAVLTPAASARTGAARGNAAYDPKGVLRYAYDLTAGGPIVFDPAKMTISDSGTAIGQLLYDSLLRKQPDGSLTPELAKGATIVDPQTVTVELKPGLKFQDGTPLDADAVAFTITRNRDANSVAFAPQIKDVGSVDVTSPSALTIHLTKPEAGAFYALLGGLATMPVSPTAVRRNDANPVTNPMGAGPFKVQEYVPEQHLVLTKSADYWNAKNIKLGGIEFVNTPIGSPSVNSLRAGTVDATGSDLSQLAGLQGGGIRAATAPSATSLLWFTLCKAQKPLDDVRVRQALNYALDRDAVNQGLADGKGEPAWSVVPKSSSLFASNLDGHYAYNPKKARKLLVAAGYPNGVQLTVMAQPGIGSGLAEIAQQSWKKAGIDLTILPTNNFVQDLFIDHKANMGAVSVVRSGLEALQTIYTPGNLGDLCNYEDPQLTAMLGQLATLPTTDPKYTDLWKQAQAFVVDNGLSVYGVWLPAVMAYDSSRVGGMRIVFPGVSPYPDFFSAYVKK